MGKGGGGGGGTIVQTPPPSYTTVQPQQSPYLLMLEQMLSNVAGWTVNREVPWLGQSPIDMFSNLQSSSGRTLGQTGFPSPRLPQAPPSLPGLGGGFPGFPGLPGGVGFPPPLSPPPPAPRGGSTTPQGGGYQVGGRGFGVPDNLNTLVIPPTSPPIPGPISTPRIGGAVLGPPIPFQMPPSRSQ